MLENFQRGKWGEETAPLQGKAAAVVLTGASGHHFLAVDGLRNVLANPHVGLLSLVPDRGETLRINGRARLVTLVELVCEQHKVKRPDKQALLDVLLVLDAAYAEYIDGADDDGGMELARHAPNVLVTRTFSKMYGLAAERMPVWRRKSASAVCEPVTSTSVMPASASQTRA